MERQSPPRVCRSVTPAWLVYAQVAFTAVSGLTALALLQKKIWVPAFVLLAAATITGVHADTTLRIWLSTNPENCNDKRVRSVLFFHETFTALVILFWLAGCIWLAYQKRQN